MLDLRNGHITTCTVYIVSVILDFKVSNIKLIDYNH
jgi:hypothetical protein